MVKIKLVREPTIAVLADFKLDYVGVSEMARWIKSHRPDCLPENMPFESLSAVEPASILPHECKESDNELLVEIAGRKCYDSFGGKAGRKTNKEYIAHTQSFDVPHASLLYHAKCAFFFAGISRRMSHELIRNYVGADRDQEGSPSQESTRFTHHYGHYVVPPYVEEAGRGSVNDFQLAMRSAHGHYSDFIDQEIELYRKMYGKEPRGMARKRIYEAAAGYLPGQAETSFIWSTNVAAIAKMVRERAAESADAEFQRFASKLRDTCVKRWPNVFPQEWMAK